MGSSQAVFRASVCMSLVCVVVLAFSHQPASGQAKAPVRPRFELPEIDIAGTMAAELDGDVVVLTYPDYHSVEHVQQYAVSVPQTVEETVEKEVNGEKVQVTVCKTVMFTETRARSFKTWEAHQLKSERVALNRVQFFNIDGVGVPEAELRRRLTSRRLVIFWRETAPTNKEVPASTPYKHLFRDDVMFITGTEHPLELAFLKAIWESAGVREEMPGVDGVEGVRPAPSFAGGEPPVLAAPVPTSRD